MSQQFGEYIIKPSAIIGVRFYEFLDPLSEKYEHIPCVRIFLSSGAEIDLVEEDYEEFKIWWDIDNQEVTKSSS